MVLARLVSGGQTGADRAALDAALAAGFPCGGWCPSQRQAEDGPIPMRYPLQELNGGYPARTLANVKHSDATLIVYRDSISGGTASTLRFCKQQQRPYLLIDSAQFEVQQAVAMIRQFVLQHQVETLNVAGHEPAAVRRYMVIPGMCWIELLPSTSSDGLTIPPRSPASSTDFGSHYSLTPARTVQSRRVFSSGILRCSKPANILTAMWYLSPSRQRLCLPRSA